MSEDSEPLLVFPGAQKYQPTIRFQGTPTTEANWRFLTIWHQRQQPKQSSFVDVPLLPSFEVVIIYGKTAKS